MKYAMLLTMYWRNNMIIDKKLEKLYQDFFKLKSLVKKSNKRDEFVLFGKEILKNHIELLKEK